MSTATTARVRSPIAASTAAGSRLSVRESTSAKTGVAPSKMKQLAVATKEIGDVITSSPAPRPAMWQSRWRPAVPLETAAAYGAPTRSANASSNRSIVGPSESLPERSTSATSSSSRSSSQGLESPIVLTAATLRRGGRHLDDVEPVAPALAVALHRVEVCLLQLTRDRTNADLAVVDRPDGSHLGRRADHEHLVGEIQVGADQQRLLDAMPEVLGDLDDRVARDARQDRHRERRRVQDVVLHDEDVLARPVGDVAVVREHDRLVVTAAACLHGRKHRVQVDPCRLRDVRDDVRADALPARDLRGDPEVLAVLTEVRAPR